MSNVQVVKMDTDLHKGKVLPRVIVTAYQRSRLRGNGRACVLKKVEPLSKSSQFQTHPILETLRPLAIVVVNTL